MYIERLVVRNYRSIQNLDIPFAPGKNVIVGRNNAGKSNIIKALDVLLGEYSPSYNRNDLIRPDDFCCGKNEDGSPAHSDEIFIYCELRRGFDELLNYEAFCKCRGTFIHNDRIPAEDFDQVFSVDDDRATRSWLNIQDDMICRREFENKYCFAYALRAKKSEDGIINRELRFLYREDPTKDWVLSFNANIRTELIQSAIVPSFRDPQNQLRLTKWTWYGKLMQHLTNEQSQSCELQEAFHQLKVAGDNVFAEVKEKVSNSTLRIAFPGTELHFQFNQDAGPDIFKNCVLYVDDGFKSQLSEKGSGIQSATIIGLFTYYTQNLNPQTSALLVVEEPEVYLHPHARRSISDRLDEFLDGNKNQVILTTHSIEFIRTSSQNLHVILVNKDDDGTKAESVKINEYTSLFIDNNQHEIFFADKVILCEGFDDFVLRQVAEELFPYQLDENNVSIISVGGKDRISKLAKLIVKLGIKCFIFADFDFLLRDKLEERKKYDALAHDSVVNLHLSFFQQTCIYGPKANNVYSHLVKHRAILKSENESAFYKAKTRKEFENKEIDRILRGLRSSGLCILDGQIEDCCTDNRFISSPNNKLDLNKVYELRSRLASGMKMSDLFDLNQFQPFLDTVFKK